ncbi:MAG: cell division protein, partial [Salinibacterium sp.]|nr:cell division protein [Salinibacterium sp.]
GRHGGARHLAGAADAAWDEVSDLAGRLDHDRGAEPDPGAHELILIDDLDSLLLRFTPDHRSEFVARLSRILRDGGASGIAVAMAAQRLSTEVQPLAALAGTTIPLAPVTRQELSLLGLDPTRFVTGLPPGGGIWRGDRVQVLFAPLQAGSERTAAIADIRQDRPLAVVSGHPAATIERLNGGGFSIVSLSSADTDPRELVVSDGRGQVALIGDAEQWQSRWGALASLRPLSDVLFHRCSLADIRALTRSRELPPVLSDDQALCWRWRDDGGFDRVRLKKRIGRT